jgi:hypothetical protein
LWNDQSLNDLAAALSRVEIFLKNNGRSFQEIFDQLQFVVVNDGNWTVRCSNANYPGGCTEDDGTMIMVSQGYYKEYSLGYQNTSYVDLFIHEMGHALLNRIAAKAGVVGEAGELPGPTLAKNLIPADLISASWGSGDGAWRITLPTRASLPEEQFADMFLGVVCGYLTAGDPRYDFMQKYLSE